MNVDDLVMLVPMLIITEEREDSKLLPCGDHGLNIPTEMRPSITVLALFALHG
jgi:hypothetical protein